jgi:hypothetical protein
MTGWGSFPLSKLDSTGQLSLQCVNFPLAISSMTDTRVILLNISSIESVNMLPQNLGNQVKQHIDTDPVA